MRPIAMAMLPVLLAAAPAATPRAGIEHALADSAAGWNADDLARFVAIYAPDATFVTKAGLVQGRDAIAGHYRASFAGGRNRRGRLSFVISATRTVDPTHLMVFARYHLEGVGTGEDGPTTLLFKHGRDGWRIVADHSG